MPRANPIAEHTAADPLCPRGYRLLINLPDTVYSADALATAARIFGARIRDRALVIVGSNRFDRGNGKNVGRLVKQKSGFRVYVPKKS